MSLIDLLVRAGLLAVLILIGRIVWIEAQNFHRAGMRRLAEHHQRTTVNTSHPTTSSTTAHSRGRAA